MKKTRNQQKMTVCKGKLLEFLLSFLVVDLISPYSFILTSEKQNISFHSQEIIPGYSWLIVGKEPIINHFWFCGWQQSFLGGF
jgi:hypothetical protein